MKVLNSIIFSGFLAVPAALLAQDADIAGVTQEEVRAGGVKACAMGNYKIAYSHSVSEAAIVKQVRHFADERSVQLGDCVTVVHDNTQNNNLEQQINAVQGWITQGVDAIVVTPIDEAALKPFQKRAQAEGIKWLTYLGTMEGSDGYVGFNHAQSGQIVGQAAVDWVKSNDIENPTALITTLKGLPSLAPRWTEVERLFSENGIEVVTMQDSADQASGLSLTETTLLQHPDLDIIIGLNDDAAVGAYRAVKIAGIDAEKIFIAGQDGSHEGLLAVNDGDAYKASAAILINELGANIVDLALNAIADTGPSSAYTPTVLATKSNQALLDELIANYEK